MVASSKWSEDWELILNPTKSEHLPVGDTSNPVTCSLTSHTSTNAQLIHTVRSVRDLGLLLITGFSADDNAARVTFYLKRSFIIFIFLPMYKASFMNITPTLFDKL